MERALTIKPTSKASPLSTSGHCPLCKASINKRSVAKAEAIDAVAQAYNTLLLAWERDTGRIWSECTEGAAVKSSNSRAAVPLSDHTLSQLCPAPEKPSPKNNENGNKKIAINKESPINKQTAIKRRPKRKIDVPSNSSPINPFPSTKPFVVEDAVWEKPKSVTSSLLSKSQNATLHEWCATFGIAYTPLMDPEEVDVLLVHAPNLITKRTLKYCRAVLSGKSVIAFECTQRPNISKKHLNQFQFFASLGIEGCLAKGELVPMAKFEVKGDEAFPDSGAPSRSRLSRQNKVEMPSLTTNCKIIFLRS